MGILKWFWSAYWDGILGRIVFWIEGAFHLESQTGWKEYAWKIFFTLIVLIAIYEVYLRIRALYRSRKFREEATPVISKEEAYATKDSRFVEKLEAAQHPEQTIRELKKAKKWDHLAEVLSSLNRHKESAYAWKKAGDMKRGAIELARAGKTIKAARWLEKTGDFATAGRFYMEKGKYLRAAKAYEKINDIPNTANAFCQAGKWAEAANAFQNYFATSKDSMAQQNQAADLCYQLLQNEKACAAIPDEALHVLFAEVAKRFDLAQRSDLAAKLYREGGNPGVAGEIYLRLGRLEEAAQCMKEAGRSKESLEIGARYYESRGLWKEAALAYEGAGDFRRAGDCYAKLNDALRAAQYYERAGEYFGAGFALVHVGKWEKAIPMFQKVKENHPRFNESRGFLGRCFYELNDYAHCAAALENHLTGARITNDNVEYFWMLALAYEQLGELEKSKVLLQKIRTVNMQFRDVSQRLSLIESRISMGVRMGPPPSGMVTAPTQVTGVMEMVANSLGTRYRLERELGRGGMGTVYLAHDTQLDRPVALKFLGSLIDDSDEYRQRFIREAKAAARVSHPNIVSIYDIGSQEGAAYIAMEYVEGQNLHTYVMNKGPLDAREAVNIIAQTCSALDAVHQAGIIHRDIKPDNIIMSRGGLVKLMDFGLAKVQGMRLTASNVVMGTPCYMSPEQINGKEADARSDIYSLGLVMHELLTGNVVFTGENVLQRQLTEVPPAPAEVNPNVPPEVDALVMKCIAKDPGQRFQSIGELITALRQLGKK
ncbi:MAG TPA: protein kinase [Candidatus Hydrogenedentes bacterium]|nr:protein kinase [Candidatus Hydrogenedentota bacterium]